jgi:hypothetical protein
LWRASFHTERLKQLAANADTATRAGISPGTGGMGVGAAVSAGRIQRHTTIRGRVTDLAKQIESSGRRRA